jgi:hypothetical protein
MDAIEYRCPLHGVVATRSRENYAQSEDLQRCPLKRHPGDTACGRPLFLEFARPSDGALAS